MGAAKNLSDCVTGTGGALGTGGGFGGAGRDFRFEVVGFCPLCLDNEELPHERNASGSAAFCIATVCKA